MPAGRFRSRSKKRVAKKLPGGRTKIFYREASGKAKCAICGKPLHGVPKYDKHRKLPKSMRAPNRPYSNLCPSCSRKILIEKALEV